MFKIMDTQMQGLKILEPKIFEDSRGKFIKTFTNDLESYIADAKIKNIEWSK